MQTLKSAAFIIALVVATGCGGGSSKSNTQSGPMATVTVALDGLMTQNTSLVLPTYVSHLYGAAPGQDVATITVQNTGTDTTNYVTTIELPTYASALGTKMITLGAGASQTFGLSPALNLTSLFALTTNVPGVLNVKVTAGTTTVYQNSTNIQISGRDTVFWTEGAKNVAALVTTMVTPNDKALLITALAHNAGLLFPGGALLGYQGGAAWPSASVGTIAPNTYAEEHFRILAGDSPTVTIDAVVNGIGGADVASVYILDDTNFAAFVGGTTATYCAGSTTAGAGTTLTCPTPAEGAYHIVYLNPSTNLTSRTVTRSRSMGRWETTYVQAEAIFLALRNAGLIYANLPGSSAFFSSSQNVMYPSESLTTLNANCIEGSLVFSSVWERMGMQPILLVDFTHGHAFTAVRCWSGSSCVIPVETTMVGGVATFDSAVSTATTNWNAWGAAGDNSATLLDVAAERAAGINPAPM